jgi:hypothetical protein
VASQIQICNLAIGYLGAEPILNIDEETKTGRVCKLVWDIVRDEMLVEHAWNFATKLAGPLALLEDAPVYDWSYAYELPGDCLRLLQADSGGERVIMVTMGSTILSNSEDIYIRYIYRVTQPGLFPAAFVSAMAARLGAELALTLTDSQGRFEGLYKLYQMRMGQAKLQDTRENNNPDSVESDSWLESRGEYSPISDAEIISG